MNYQEFKERIEKYSKKSYQNNEITLSIDIFSEFSGISKNTIYGWKKVKSIPAVAEKMLDIIIFLGKKEYRAIEISKNLEKNRKSFILAFNDNELLRDKKMNILIFDDLLDAINYAKIYLKYILNNSLYDSICIYNGTKKSKRIAVVMEYGIHKID